MSGPSTTRWTFIVAGRDPDGSRYEEAWRYLFGAYRPVIVAYFARHAPEQTTAAEWADEFLAAWVEGSLDRADPEKGSFRRYLARSLRNFRFKRHRDEKPRGGIRTWLGLGGGGADDDGAPRIDPADEGAEDAERWFARAWAGRVLELALEKLRLYQRARRAQDGKSRPFDLVRAYHLPANDADRPGQRELAERFGLTEKAVERQLDHARKKLRDWILQEIRESVADEDELGAEVEVLLAHGRDVLGALDLTAAD